MENKSGQHIRTTLFFIPFAGNNISRIPFFHRDTMAF